MGYYRLTGKGKNLVDEMDEELGYLDTMAASILRAVSDKPVSEGIFYPYRGKDRESLKYLVDEGYIWLDKSYED